MCYNEKASLYSFVTGMASSCILAYYNPVVAFFFAWISCMQLFDYIFWRNLTKNTLNYATTKVAILFNNLQPIVLALLIVFLGKQKLRPLSVFLISLYICIAVALTFISLKQVDYTLVTEESAPSLYWKWNYMPYGNILYLLFILSVVSMFVQHFRWPLNFILTATSITTFIYSFTKFKKHRSIGRMWCHINGYVPLIIVIFYILAGNKFIK